MGHSIAPMQLLVSIVERGKGGSVMGFYRQHGLYQHIQASGRGTAASHLLDTLGFGTLLLAHLSFDIPYVILNVLPKLRQMDSSLIDAAQDLGCTWMGAFWKVIVPEIKPGIVSGALIAFTMSIDDFVISYFTAGSASTLSIEIYGMVRRRVSPELNAVSTLLFVVVLILLVIINVREARQEKALRRSTARK